jgi:hypothetical protein
MFQTVKAPADANFDGETLGLTSLQTNEKMPWRDPINPSNGEFDPIDPTNGEFDKPLFDPVDPTAGKFNVDFISNDNDVNVVDYLSQHKCDIIGYIGDELGMSDDESENCKLYYSPQSTSPNNNSSFTVAYSGFKSHGNVENKRFVGTVVKRTLSDVLDEIRVNYNIGDIHHVEQQELDRFGKLERKQMLQNALQNTLQHSAQSKSEHAVSLDDTLLSQQSYNQNDKSYSM